MYHGNHTYGRRPFIPKARTEADDAADALFGPLAFKSSVPTNLPPPVTIPPAPAFPSYAPSVDSLDSDTVERTAKKRRKAQKPKTTFRISLSPQPEVSEPEDDDWVQQSSHGSKESGRSDRNPPPSETYSDTNSKKAEKKRPNPVIAPPLFYSTTAARRKKVPTSSDGPPPDPTSDPDYLRFMAEMEDLKNYPIKIQDADEYHQETSKNAAKDMSKLTKSLRDSRHPGYSLDLHYEKHRTQKTMLPPGLGDRDSEFEDESPVESTLLKPDAKKRKEKERRHAQRHSPDISMIEDATVTPRLSTAILPSRKISAKNPIGVQGRLTMAEATSPMASTPLDRKARPLHLEMSAVQNQSPIVMKNLSRELSHEGDGRRSVVPEAEPSGSKGLRKSKADVADTPRKTVPPRSSSRIKPAAQPLVDEITLRIEQDLVEVPTPTVVEPTTSRRGNLTAEQPPKSGRSTRKRETTTGAPILSASHASQLNPRAPPRPAVKKRRESLPVFSPAIVSSQEDQRLLSQSHATRSSRRSVVVNAQKRSPQDLLLAICTPNHIINTEHILGKDYVNLTKIGEGSYADVYSAYLDGEEVVMKIVPVDGHYENGEKQTSYEDILSESLISIELTRTLARQNSPVFYAPVFAHTFFIKIACGEYPEEFSDKHDSFARAHEEDAFNQHPVAYGADQHYVIIGLNNGGRALDTFPLASFSQAKSVFQQVAFGLAVAEAALEFEHRDAHISNILVSLTQAREIRFLLHGQEYRIPSHGLQVTIIDWTLSRMKTGSQIVYKDLTEDDDIFNGHGDEQFDVYRDMRSENNNDWEKYHPKTNVRWLKYLQQKLLKEKNIKDDPVKKVLRDLNVGGRLMQYTSACDLVQKAAMFRACLVVEEEVEV